MTYTEYRQARQDAFNALPLFWAFNKEQFKEAMEARGLTENDTDKLYKLPNGGGAMYLKTDAPIVRKFFEDSEKEPKLSTLMKDFAFAKDAIYYEMCNHEYGINGQGNWDVCSCFADEELPYYGDEYYGAQELEMYFDAMNWGDDTRRAWRAASNQYRKDANENGWF